ncbi:MAG: restriction endonuclease subunit S [Pseudomonadota bacterium]|nr:restriction endonuclease subunit S [Pseudomonadota bacterium]
MNPERLLALYERITEAPDAVPRLRRFILDLAVRGKLVPQDPTDEPASELLKRIAAEKARLVKVGEIRKPKALLPITDEEVSFSLPNSWTWVRLGILSKIVTSGSRDWAKFYAPDGAIFVRMSNLSKYHYWLRLDNIQYINPPDDGEGTRTRLEGGDILISITGDVGMLGLIPDGFGEAYINQHTAMVRPMPEMNGRYLPELFRSPFAQNQFNAPQRGIKNSFRLTDVTQFVVPLPPLAEQHRIVARVDELMALLDRLAAARTAREATRDRLGAASLARLTAPDTPAEDFSDHARFALDALPALTARPDQVKALRQTILNLAVRGKLVPQDPTDEPASALLKRIAAERAAFLDANYPNPSEAKTQKKKQAQQRLPSSLPELPLGWSWATLQQCSLMVIDCKNKTAPYSSTGIKLVRTTNVRDGSLNSNDQKFVSEATYEAWSLRAKPEPGDILITREAPMGEVCIIPDGERICLGQRMMLARLVPDTIDGRFMLYSLRDPDLMERVQDKPLGMTVQHLRVGGVETLLVPLPPLAEQQRLVAKVDAFMALCDRLEAALSAVDAARARLLQALLHEALEPATTVQDAAA